jgi:DNA-binding CsgD family transcriptional regulator
MQRGEYRMMKKKSNKAEIAERKLYVLNLLLEGKSTKEICRITSEKWQISRRQIERYISSSYTNLLKQFDKKGEVILEYNIALRMNLYNKSYDEGKYRTCLTILKDIAKIEGLYNNI